MRRSSSIKYFHSLVIDHETQLKHKMPETTIQKFEAKYPDLAINLKNLMDEHYALFASKMLDYGIKNISLGTNLETEQDKKLSLTGIWIRCTDKMNRLKNLLFEPNGVPENESVEDSYKDIATYNLIAQLILKDQWK